MDMPTWVFRARVYTAPESMASMVASSSWCSSIRSASLQVGKQHRWGGVTDIVNRLGIKYLRVHLSVNKVKHQVVDLCRSPLANL